MDKQIDLHVRAAKWTGAGYLIDLCDEQWRAVLVTPTGWQVLNHSPAYGPHPVDATAMPRPASAAATFALAAHQHPGQPSRDGTGLVARQLRPDTPFPVLELVEQGSAKSRRPLRSLVDPNKVMLRGRPKTVEDIFVAAANNWLVFATRTCRASPPNSRMPSAPWPPGGFASRQLYTNWRRAHWKLSGPVVLNGIAVVATRPDLIDRVIHVICRRSHRRPRRDEADTSAAWGGDRPKVFGALLPDLFRQCLRRILLSVKRPTNSAWPTTNDGGLWPAPSVSSPAQRLYAELVRIGGTDRALESNAVAQVLDKYFEEQDAVELAGHRRPHRTCSTTRSSGSQYLAEVATGSPSQGSVAPHRPRPIARPEGYRDHSIRPQPGRRPMAHAPIRTHSTATPPGVEGGVMESHRRKPRPLQKPGPRYGSAVCRHSDHRAHEADGQTTQCRRGIESRRCRLAAAHPKPDGRTPDETESVFSKSHRRYDKVRARYNKLGPRGWLLPSEKNSEGGKTITRNAGAHYELTQRGSMCSSDRRLSIHLQPALPVDRVGDIKGEIGQLESRIRPLRGRMAPEQFAKARRTSMT